MEPLQIIKEACIKANPDIKKQGVLDVYIGSFRNPRDAEKWCREFHDIKSIEITPVREESEHGYTSVWCKIEILGRPIRLADVLLAIHSKKESWSVWQGALTPDTSIAIDDLVNIHWELTDDNLDHQSPETIEFLASLLTK